MLRLLTRAMPMVAPQLRTIYSESFLGIDVLRAVMTRNKLAIAEPGKFVQEMRSEYGDNGIGNMSDEDLHRDAIQCFRDVYKVPINQG